MKTGKIEITQVANTVALNVNHEGSGAAVNVEGGNLEVGGGSHCITTTGSSNIFGLGNPSATDKEYLRLEWDASNSVYHMRTVKAGAGAGRSLWISAADNATVPLVIRGLASQSANLQEWQNSSGTALTAISKDGYLSCGPLTLSNGSSSLTFTEFGNDWTINNTNGSGAIVLKARSTGSPTLSLGTAGGVASFTDTSLTIQPSIASLIPLTVKGTTSQTANLQEWQDSAGAARLWVDNNGAIVGRANASNSTFFYFATSDNYQSVSAVATSIYNVNWTLAQNTAFLSTSLGGPINFNFGLNQDANQLSCNGPFIIGASTQGHEFSHVTTASSFFDMRRQNLMFWGATTGATWYASRFRQTTAIGQQAGNVVTDSATLRIDGPPIASGANITLTNVWSLWVGAGTSRFDGPVNVNSNIQRSVQSGITASTTQTQGQESLTKDINEVSTVANTNDTVTLPSAVAGMSVFIRNNGANTLQIFPASGDNINATGVNTAVTLAAGASVTYHAIDATNWYS